MAGHAYLFIKGIEGGCKAEGHEKEIEITKLTQSFSFSKESIKVGNIDGIVKQNLNFARNFLDTDKSAINEMADKLIEEFREYKKHARHGVGEFNSELLSRIQKEAKENLTRQLRKKITQNSTREINSEINRMQNEIGGGVDIGSLFSEGSISSYDKYEQQIQDIFLNQKKADLRKKMDEEFDNKVESQYKKVLGEFETNIEKLIKNIKDSVSKRDPLDFTKYFDKSSPKLLEACCTGQIFDECRLMLYRSVYPTGSGRVTLSAELLNNFVHIKFYNAYVTSYNISHSDESNLPVENIKMNYDKVEFKFAQGDPKTGKKGQQKIISWDWTTNKAEEKGG